MHALRVLRKSPGFTLVAVLTLALGIGANTAIFSVVHGVLLAPLRYPDAGRIVSLNTLFRQTGHLTRRLTGGDLVDIREDSRVFDAISYYFGGELGVQLRERAEFTGTYFVNAGFFRVFGVIPIAGRLFRDQEVERSAVVSLAFAQRNFGSGETAIGRTISVENRAYEIVGVLPAEFQYPRKAEVWIPGSYTPENLDRTAYNYPSVARLKPGVPLEAAQARLDTIAARLAGAFPASNRNKAFVATPLREQLVGPLRSTLYFLMGAVGLVLLISCANVAHLLLARATARSREIAVRVALGESRSRIIRELTVENAVLGLLGGALGLLIAWLGINALVHLAPDNLPRMTEIRLDPFVLAFATGLSLLASLLFGLAPAWQTANLGLNDALKQGASRGTVGGRSNRLRSALVIAEIALSFVLAIGAGLFFRSLITLVGAPLGYRAEGVLVMYAHAPARTLQEHVQVGRFFQNLTQQLGEIHGVKSVAIVMGLPSGQYGSNGLYAIEGKHTFAPGQNLPQAGFELASPAYFAAMGIPLLKGRDFSARDDYDAPFVAIVSESLVKQTFPNEDPIGRRVQCGLDSPKWMTIVGVVGDVRQDSPASSPGPELYMPLQQHPFYGNEVQVVLRTASEPSLLIAAVRTKVHDANPSVATKFTTMEAMVATSVSTPRFRTFLVSVFAGVALLLAMAGVYGVMSYVAAQRTSELGLRMALGAQRGDIMALILGRAVLLAAIGLAAGAGIAVASGRIIEGMLFGIEPTDAATYLAVLIALALVTLAAAAVPAWRATRIDPLTALREE